MPDRSASHRDHHGQPLRLGDDAPRRRDARRARRRLRGQGRLGPPHARPALRLCQERRRARPQGDHRRRRRRRASARHGRLDDPPAGARRAGREPRPCPASTACSRSSRCPPACRSARWRSARPARSMPACSRPRSSPPPTRRSPSGSRPGARTRPTASPKQPGMIVPPGSTIGIIGGGQLGRMLALAAAQLGYRCHVYAPDADSVAARGRGRLHAGRVRRRRRADPLRRRGRRRHLRVREHPDRAARRARRARAAPPAGRRAGDRPGPARGEELRPAPSAAGPRRSRAVDDQAGLDAALARDRRPGHPQDAALRL